MYSQKIPRKVSVFDCLLIRCLILAATGQDYSAELANARTLVQLLEGGVR